jgi:hypothetical protein
MQHQNTTTSSFLLVVHSRYAVAHYLALDKHALTTIHQATYIFNEEPNRAVTHLRIMGNG